MFPTRVGMNREPAWAWPRFTDVPHTCGDEPAGKGNITILGQMFPTRVGMNRA